LANEFKHKTVGTQLTQAEFEQVDGHVLNSQQTDDTIRAASATSLIRIPNTFSATDAPDANDDTGDGWVVGSQWLDTTNDIMYVAIDVTSTAAVWIQITDIATHTADDDAHHAKYTNAEAVDAVEAATALVFSPGVTISGATHTSPILNGTLSGTAFLDEDDLVSDSAIAAASQQSIKAYVDAAIAAVEGNLTAVGKRQVATTTEDLNQTAGTYDLFTGTDQVFILTGLSFKMPNVDASDDASLTSISIITDDVTPAEIISTITGAVANLTAEAELSWTGFIRITVGTKIQLVIAGGAADATTVALIVAEGFAVVAGGNLS
jgi:hypothetical protein